MRTRLLVALSLLVLLPLVLLAWLGGRATRGEQARLRERFEALMTQRLTEVKRGMAETIAAQERELTALLESVPIATQTAQSQGVQSQALVIQADAPQAVAPQAVAPQADAPQADAPQADAPQADAQQAVAPQAVATQAIDMEAWRGAARRHRMVTAVFVLDPRGRMAHPPLEADTISSDELAFLQRTQGLWSEGGTWGAAAGEGGTNATQGWRVWYHGGAPRLLFWRRLASRHVVGVELPAAVLVAELVGKMPNSPAGGVGEEQSRVVWIDPQGQPVYEWGQAPAGAPAAARQAAPPPFAAWNLAIYAPDVVAAGANAWRVQWWAGLGAAALALSLLAVYLHRESTRDLRLAARRITFVNQVSHELKTPLTNISLYAELAAERLPGDATAARECLDVVVGESARLGRLINNVLTFSRHQRGTLRPRRQRCELDPELAALVQPFAPALEERSIRLELDLHSGAVVMADPDALGQILGNLLSNIEKYAAAGAWAGISSRVRNGFAEVVVADRGPGIPPALATKVFEPFYRASDKLSDGVAGLGLGLSLARELARAMEGDLELAPAAAAGGCSFILRLPLATS